MARAFTLAGMGLVWVLSAACSSKSGAPAGAGGSGGAGGTSGGASGSAGKSSGSGPAISSAPPAWARPADCGGIGNLCPNLSGCAEKSVCQLEGNVCIPKYAADAQALPDRSAETPYCAAYTCMTFDEASCFCTGDAGKSVPACKSPSELALLCVSLGASCDEQPCCDGYSCVSDGAGHKQCQVPCETNADCADTGCCTDPHEVGVDICSPKSACDNPCKKRGAACMGSATVSANCCTGTCVIADNPAFAGCRPTCLTNADCDTGCCVPFDGKSNGFCADAAFCSCGNVGAECGPNAPDCCAGTSCGAYKTETFTCSPSCKVAADCSTQCCSLFKDQDNGVCVPAADCGL